MGRAMERYENEEAHVIPVILRPCDWHGLPFGKLLATPPDGVAVTKFPNQDDAFLEVAKAIRGAAEGVDATQGGSLKAAESPGARPGSNPIANSPKPKTKSDIRSGNLRLKKHFTDHEKDTFLDKAFEYIANHFEGSLAELEQRYPDISTRFKRIDSNQLTATIYASGHLACSCRIWMGGQQTFGGIAYSASERSYDNSINESLSVDDDGYSLFLKPLMSFRHGSDNQQLTHEGGAEYFWSTLIGPLQR